MDGSFNPESNSSIERNIDAKNEIDSENIENQSQEDRDTQTRSTLEESNNVETISSLNNKNTYQVLYYKDTDESKKFGEELNNDVITENNPKVLSPSQSYVDARTPPIIDEKNLRKLERIGFGSNGEVFKYMHEPCSELVAVKEEFGKKTEKNEKIVNEYLKLYDLNHTNIIKLIGIVPKNDSSDWVVMELGECTLRTFLNDYKTYVPFKIPDRICIDYSLQIAYGMREAHSKNILHADLNSNNIVFKKRPKDTEEMKTSLLKIIDFSDEKVTKGTLTHMAPELVLDRIDEPTKQSDIYSAGVVFLEIYTLAKPFENQSSYNVLDFHQNKKSLTLPEDCPEQIKSIIESCLNIDPNVRPTFKKIIEDLENIIDQFPYDDEEEDEYEEEEGDEEVEEGDEEKDDEKDEGKYDQVLFEDFTNSNQENNKDEDDNSETNLQSADLQINNAPIPKFFI